MGSSDFRDAGSSINSLLSIKNQPVPSAEVKGLSTTWRKDFVFHAINIPLRIGEHILKGEIEQSWSYQINKAKYTAPAI